MKIVLTNWINLIGVFLVTFGFSFITTLTDTYPSYNIYQAIFAALFLVLGYGMMFWLLFIISLIILDLMLLVTNRNNLKLKLLMEWLVISSPFIYWTIEYREWIFISAVVAFLIAQQLRGILIIAKEDYQSDKL
jgi:hypothetical protein